MAFGPPKPACAAELVQASSARAVLVLMLKLVAADRILDRIAAMPARTLEGIKVKLRVLRASSMLEAWPLEDSFTLPIFQDIERLGIQGMA
jgi:hypothetical protein